MAGLHDRRPGSGEINLVQEGDLRALAEHIDRGQRRLLINGLGSGAVLAQESYMGAARFQREDDGGLECEQGSLLQAEEQVDLSAEEDRGEAPGFARDPGSLLRPAQRVRDERRGGGARAEVRGLRRRGHP